MSLQNFRKLKFHSFEREVLVSSLYFRLLNTELEENLIRIAHHPAYIHPLPEGHRFPMLKYELIPGQLLHEGIVEETSFFKPDLASYEVACLAHDPTYVQELFSLSIDSKMIRRIGFPLSQGLIDRERYIVDGTIKSALYALQDGVSFNTAGGTHHAGFDYGEGFCLLNDQAVAAQYILKHGFAKRILIIDLDVHQGNGTAHIFKNHPSVFTFSMHGEKNFPFIKEQSFCDIPLPDGITDATYLTTLSVQLTKIWEQVKPDFVFYQAGVDILASDKLGKLKISPQGCKDRDIMVLSLCCEQGVPVQISMGGGYSPQIRDILHAHMETYKAAMHIYGF